MATEMRSATAKRSGELFPRVSLLVTQVSLACLKFGADEFAADLGSAEMTGPIRGYQLYGFIDAGIVWNNGSPIQQSLSSGIRVALQDEYRAGFEIALPLDYHSFANQDDGTRFYFSLSKTFRGCPLCGR